VVFGLLPRLDIGNVWINLAIVYGLSIPLAFLSHRYFEMPAQRFIRRARPCVGSSTSPAPAPTSA
jgi:peptidoglycan/LPS O-acetylase OafA/YrhL